MTNRGMCVRITCIRKIAHVESHVLTLWTMDLTPLFTLFSDNVHVDSSHWSEIILVALLMKNKNN